jgi:hypothetical protein
MAAKKTTYVVTAPYITVLTGTPEGSRILGLYAGAHVPDDVPDDVLQHLLVNDLIAVAASDGSPVDDDAEKPAPAKTAAK